MIHFTVGDVMDAVEPRSERSASIAPSTCPRSAQVRGTSGERLFVGLEGLNFDGARFARAAIHGGAVCVLASDSPGCASSWASSPKRTASP